MDAVSRVGFLPIPQVAPVETKSAAAGRAPGEPSAVASFQQLLNDAVESVNTAQLQADHMATQLAAGERVDLHQVTIALERASIAFQLALQVRTKLLEAYQEVMRTQV